MAAALARLSDQERRDILAYYSDGSPVGAQARESRGALRVRMARTRAKLRLEYLLAFRHVELPSPACRSVLLAISVGDTRRQRESGAGQHLLDRATCATLSEPLDRRSVALTTIAIPGALAAWAAGKHEPTRCTPRCRSPPDPRPSPRPRCWARSSPAPLRPPPRTYGLSSAPAPPAPVAVISHLSVAGHAVSDAEAQRSLRPLIGTTATASGATVVAAVTRNGFWIGSSRARIWVQLTGPLRPLQIRAGNRVHFTGTLIGDPPSYPAQAGLRGSDAALLARQGAHLAVSTTRIWVQH